MAVGQVIVAEDEAPLRRVIDEILSDNGLKVLAAADGVEALALIEANPGASLLLSDVKMPRMDGYDLAEAALALRPELKIVMMTGFADLGPPPSILRAREIRVLLKPLDLERLRALIDDMLGRP